MKVLDNVGEGEFISPRADTAPTPKNRGGRVRIFR
jgi:hypothetical protein